MKPPYVRDLQPNQIVTSVFLVQSKDIRQKKSGEPYLSLLVGDRTGDVEAKMWDNVADVMHTFERDDFIRIKGLYQIFQNRPQITVHKLIRIDDGDVRYADFFPASERDSDEMFAELQGIIGAINNPHLRRLLDAIFADDHISRAYRLAPAAKQIHHAYLGGLIEHVLSLCKLASTVAPHYKDVDVDLVLTGCILHDLGKIDELTFERGFSYTTEGQLLGHITMGLRMVEDKLRAFPGFPPKLRMLLEHMLLSHHGELEYGSPKVPLFPEALLLHHLDNLDSKMECMRSVAGKDRHYEGCWTSFSPTLDRAVLKKAKFLDEAPEPEAPARPSSPAPQQTRANGVTKGHADAPPKSSSPAPGQTQDSGVPRVHPEAPAKQSSPVPERAQESGVSQRNPDAPPNPSSQSPEPTQDRGAPGGHPEAPAKPSSPAPEQPPIPTPDLPPVAAAVVSTAPPPPPRQQPAPAGSFFGDKLKQALKT